MTPSIRFVVLAALLCACLVVPSQVAAQAVDRPLSLGGSVSGFFGEGQPAPGVGLSAAYRLTPRLGFDVESAFVPDLDLGIVPLCPPTDFCALALFRAGAYSVHARAASLGAHVTAKLPLMGRAIQPYISGGGGVGHVRRELRDTTVPFRTAVKSTGPLLSAGGGVDIPLSNRLLLGVDLRYQRIVEKDRLGRSDIGHTLNMARMGTSVSYRF